MIRATWQRLWGSPTVMTWASLGARTLDLVLVLPLVLQRFPAAEIALWHLFLSVLVLQLVVENGFNATFVRVIAYAMGGARDLRRLPALGEAPERSLETSTGEPDRRLLAAQWHALGFVYRRLAAVVLLATAGLGTLAMWRPAGRVDDDGAWWAWLALVVISPIVLYGGRYAVFLQGVGRVALFRRWEAWSLLAGAALSAAVLLSGGGLLALVLARQGWALANAQLNRWLCSRTPERRAIVGVELSSLKNVEQGARSEVLAAVWPSAWRSSLGVGMSAGLVELSGILYAQLGSTPAVAAYLVSLKLVQGLQQWSAAPFYSQLPRLARLRSEGDREGLLRLARRGMALALGTFVAGFALVGAAGPWLLELLSSNARLVVSPLWCLMGWAVFVERYGAMHLQLFSTTNRILWHVANGISGAIYVAVALVLFRGLGVYAFPIATLAGHLGFYTWFSVRLSYRAFSLRFWPFESRALVPALAGMVAATLLLLFSPLAW